jgi:hypothetical protein
MPWNCLQARVLRVWPNRWPHRVHAMKQVSQNLQSRQDRYRDAVRYDTHDACQHVLGADDIRCRYGEFLLL